MANSNISYNGSFVSYDDKTDYQAKINQAIKAGDYAAAAQYEVQRNAKLEGMGRGNEATTNYIQVYKGSPTNNQGGVSYESKYGGIGDAPSGWTTLATTNSGTYKNDGSTISQRTGANASGPTYTPVGNSINSSTGEFAWSNPQTAQDYAYNQYIGAGGNQNVSKEYALKNLIDNDYLDAVTKGNVGTYTQVLMDKAQAARDKVIKKQRAASRVNEYGDEKNSFESESNKVPEAAVDPQELYRQNLIRLTSGQRKYIY